MLFAGVPSPRITLVPPERLLALLPFGVRLDGFPGFTVADRYGHALACAAHLLEITFAHPDVTAIEPASGRAEEDDVVPIRGAKFSPGARVILRRLFGQDATSLCEDAMDANDSGDVDLSDAVLVLDYLYLDRGPELAEPREVGDVDPTAGALFCVGPPVCP